MRNMLCLGQGQASTYVGVGNRDMTYQTEYTYWYIILLAHEQNALLVQSRLGMCFSVTIARAKL